MSPKNEKRLPSVPLWVSINTRDKIVNGKSTRKGHIVRVRWMTHSTYGVKSGGKDVKEAVNKWLVSILNKGKDNVINQAQTVQETTVHVLTLNFSEEIML